ncbi:MAG TPA: urea transporter [Polyangiales bacterium]|nr:urea transporter [Polyangiales bacterium]
MSTLSRGLTFVLQLYAGCVFSASPWTGALLLAATLFAPWSALLGLAAVSSALFIARALHLLSDRNPAAVYTYSALFIGLIAARTFGDPGVALAFALLGAATSALMTASLRELGQRFALPALSLPFVAVYLCALGIGRVLSLPWADAPPTSHSFFAEHLPELARVYLEALGAVVCDGRAEVGALVLAALFASSRHTALLPTLGFVVALSVSHWLQLAPALRLTLLLNAMFTALALGSSQRPGSAQAYALAASGALFCSLCTPSLSAPLGKVALSPLSLPFNLSFYVVLLVARRRNQPAPTGAPTHSVIAYRTPQ